jgi:caffeoyl-CoA O-methyltransferase
LVRQHIRDPHQLAPQDADQLAGGLAQVIAERPEALLEHDIPSFQLGQAPVERLEGLPQGALLADLFLNRAAQDLVDLGHIHSGAAYLRALTADPGGPVLTIADERIEEYARAHSTPEPADLAAVAETTRAEVGDRAGMMVGPLEGGLLATLVHLAGARSVLEIGTFTGYSALWMARALPPEGRIITCELDPHHAAIARRHFDQSEWGDRIELREGAALDTISSLSGPFDLVFIDADKPNYPHYFDAVVPLLSERGVVAADNVLWSGTVLDPDDDNGRALAAFNRKVLDDDRVDQVMLTVRDGITLIRRRSA